MVGVVVDVVVVRVHTGQVVIVDVEVTVIVALAAIAGARFDKAWPGYVVRIEVLVSAATISDDPGIVKYAGELVDTDTVGASGGDSAGDARGSGSVEDAAGLVGRLFDAYSDLEVISNTRIATDLRRSRHRKCLKNCLRYSHIVRRTNTQVQQAP